MKKDLMKMAYELGFQNILDSLTGDAYKVSCVKKIIFSTKYIILGRGVIHSDYLDISDCRKKLEAFDKYFIPILNDEDLKTIKDRIEIEKIGTEKQKESSEEELKKKIKQKIQTEVPELPEEEKLKIFNFVVQASTKKSEIETEYWAIYDILKSSTKTREILNIKLEKPITKNQFQIKNRKIKGE